jgi:hypothetical protein
LWEHLRKGFTAQESLR